jgi:hypothetical protein
MGSPSSDPSLKEKQDTTVVGSASTVVGEFGPLPASDGDRG